MISWNDPVTQLAFITDIWADAEYVPPTTLTAIFKAANQVCVSFAPSVPNPAFTDGAPGVIPDSWKIAEILQAKHIWARMRSGSRESQGLDGFEISTYPLVLEARGLLRPKRSPLKGLL